MTETTIRTVIVDDDPAVIRLHTAYLSSLDGFSLAGTARTGQAAAKLAASTAIDLVLLDMNLPDFSGIEVLHRLRMLREWDLDVLVISSARDSFTIRQAAAAHIVGYLVKPFTRESFEQRLTEYRRARSVRPSEVAVSLAQGEIDRFVEPATPMTPSASSTQTAPMHVAVPDALPKGLSAPTMATILDALHPTTPVSARAIAEASGASRATVRRYLDHLTAHGAVVISHRFGARGRPEVLYRLATR
jgi:response regulator of citrate/malate metabolism